MWKQNHNHVKTPSGEDTIVALPDIDVPQRVTLIGPTLVVKGELTAAEHLIIEGQFEGQLAIPDHGLAVGKRGKISAGVIARTITVLGQAKGKLTAADKIELRASAAVEGCLISETVVIEEGAYFKGTVVPKRTEAAIAVGRHRLKQQSSELLTVRPDLVATPIEQP